MEKSNSLGQLKETASSIRAKQYLYSRISKAGMMSNLHPRATEKIGHHYHAKTKSLQDEVKMVLSYRPADSVERVINDSVISSSERSWKTEKKKQRPGDAIKTNLKYLNDFEKKEITRFRYVYYIRKKHIDFNEKTFEKEGDYFVIIGDAICYRYEIKEVISAGSFGQVLMCRDHKSNENVAVKVLKKHQHSKRIGLNEFEIVEMLNKESDCSNIVIGKKRFLFRNHFFMVFELLGLNLYDFMYKKGCLALNMNLTKRITVQILSALQHIHDCNVIHCDLKPENIAFKNNNKSGIKIIDFGTSVKANKNLFCYFQTRNYRAPEVVFKTRRYDFGVDIWSLGCIVCEMIIGTSLFNAISESELLVSMCFLLGPPPKDLINKATENLDRQIENWKEEGKIRSILNGVPNEVMEFIESCLKWDPKERKTAKECLQLKWFQTSHSRSNSYDELLKFS